MSAEKNILKVVTSNEMGTNLTIEERANNRNYIMNVEGKLKEMEQADLPVKHHFGKGSYARELNIPADTLLVGKIHKYKSINILASGEISVLTEHGSKRLKAPHVVVGEAGTKRVGYAHTDVTWITIHGTEETDVDKIEEMFIAKTYDEVDALTESEIKILNDIKGS